MTSQTGPAIVIITCALFFSGAQIENTASPKLKLAPTPAAVSHELLEAWYAGDRETVKEKLALLESLAANAEDENTKIQACYFAALGCRDYSALLGDKDDRIQRLRAATDHLKKAIELNSEHAEAHALLAHVYRRLVGAGNRDPDTIHNAIVHRERAWELAPANPAVLMFEASALIAIPEDRGGDIREGIAAGFEAIGRFQIQESPENARRVAETWATIGAGFRKLQENKLAIRAYEKALDEQPKWQALRTNVLNVLQNSNEQNPDESNSK